MQRVALVAAVAFAATVALVSNANAMPTFVRQTGLTCNQCHVSIGPTPDFTFTGKKFRLNGYRAPYVAEKIEAGEEGALNGKRLMMGIQNIISFRFGQQFLAQSKTASQVIGGVKSTNNASAVTSRPFSNFSMFYVGGIGDHIGMWNETYFDQAGTNGTSATFRVMGIDEWDLKFVFNPGYDNIVGFATTTQSLSALSGFSPFSSGTAGNALQRGGVGQAHTPYGNIAAYALLKDRFLIVAGVQGGEDNYSLQGMAFQTNLGMAISNSDYNQLWYMFQMKAGNDAIPIVTNTGLSVDRNSFTYSDAFTGVSATRGSTATTRVAYQAADIGDFIRTVQEIQYGFVDRGPWSLMSSCGMSYNKETYADGAGIKQVGVGCTVRFYYNRTYGIVYGKSRFLKNEFTDKNGVLHPISQQKFVPLSGTFYYRPAMNFIVSLGWGVGTTAGGNRLDDNRAFARDGWNWSLGFDINF
jgi:hypothetical protein